jgi:hypothetical protein
MSSPTVTPSNLVSAVTGSDPTQNYPASPDQGGPVPSAQSQPNPSQPAPQPTGSRLGAIVQAIAKVASTALQGVPDTGRPGFVNGLGQGARAAQAVQATQQAIKFRDMDTQIRLAELHNQDLKLQNDTQAQTDAHVKAELDNRALANSLGIDYDTLPSHGQAVMDHLTAQTAATGAASVPPGTHLSGDGETISIPKDTQATRDGQKQMYALLAPALGLPSLSPSAQFVPPKQMNMLTNKLHGFNLDGSAPKHGDLPGMVGAAQAQRDALEKNGASPEQLKALDNMIGIYKANLGALDEHAAGVKAKNKQAELDVQNNPKNQAAAARVAGMKANAELPAKIALQNAKSSGELNAVAYDPNYQNPDGTKGANVVMNKEEAQAKGLTHYKAEANKINTVVAGMNDVQNKLNQLADVVTDPQRMGQVDPGTAAAMLAYGKGLSLEIGGHGGGASGGAGIDTSRINEKLYARAVAHANQATRDYVTAYVGAHEAVTQLPRLQTFGQSNRMTEKQMEAAINLLPHPGDGAMASQKMTSLQGMLDPLRKQIPHMPGAESVPSFLEQRQQRQKQRGGSNLGRAVTEDPTAFINRLVPSK